MIVTVAGDGTGHKVAIFVPFDVSHMQRDLAQSNTAWRSSITRYSKALIIEMPFLSRTLSLRFFGPIIIDFLTYFYSLLHVFSDGRGSIRTHRRGIIVICRILVE